MDLSQDVRNLFEKEDVVSYLRKLQGRKYFSDI